MKKVQMIITDSCPQSDQFQLVELGLNPSPELHLGGAEVTECSLLAEKAQECGRCLQPSPPGQKEGKTALPN